MSHIFPEKIKTQIEILSSYRIWIEINCFCAFFEINMVTPVYDILRILKKWFTRPCGSFQELFIHNLLKFCVHCLSTRENEVIISCYLEQPRFVISKVKAIISFFIKPGKSIEIVYALSRLSPKCSSAWYPSTIQKTKRIGEQNT